MSPSRFDCLRPVALATLLVAVAVPIYGQTPDESSELRIEAKPVAGQLDVLQGAAIQLGGKPPVDGPEPIRYVWKIVQGVGGKLYDADKPRAIFQAPKIDDDLELFVLELTAVYDGQPPAQARLHVKVHKVRPEPEDSAQPESPTQWLEDYYRAQRQRERHRSRRRAGDVTVRSQHHYPGWHWGLSFGWGWFIDYPVYIPIIIPGPGEEIGPGDGGWVEPTPIPYDEMVTTFPEEIADQYVPQDFPAMDAAAMPDIPELGSGFDLPDDPGFDTPDFSDMDGGFDIPMIDPGFDVDPFGW